MRPLLGGGRRRVYESSTSGVVGAAFPLPTLRSHAETFYCVTLHPLGTGHLWGHQGRRLHLGNISVVEGSVRTGRVNPS